MAKKTDTKYIFVCGGVLSGLGKGISTASVGLLLKNAGFSVTSIKIDPYISIDAGTMRPQEHGEVFVTKDGGEIDQDLGNYERFLHEDFTKDHNITTGKVYAQVIDNERKFVYQGRDAEIIPDVIDEIKRRIYKVSEGFDFVLVEIGGTVGDIENMPFLIAAREIGRQFRSAYVMITYLPFLHTIGELKTKPTQHAVMQLRREGISPDFIVTRAEEPVDEPRMDTIAKRCFVDRENIFDIPDVDSIYKVPEVLMKQNFVSSILKFFDLDPKDTSDELIKRWKDFANFQTKDKGDTVKICLVGKYVKHGSHNHNDTYISVLEALRHACFANKVRLDLRMISSESLTEANYTDELKDCDGIIVPQGWGSRGFEGKLLAIQYCRENNVPYLGLCYGMQMAVIEFSRNVLGLKDANSEEIDPESKNKVIHLMEEQKKHMKEGLFGGTIRLGDWPMVLTEGSRAEAVYGKFKIQNSKLKNSEREVDSSFNNGTPSALRAPSPGKETPSGLSATFPGEGNPFRLSGTFPKEGDLIYERHRHRYEFNNEYKERLEKAGLKVSGKSPDGTLVEMVEITGHKFFIGTQAHPEYKSRPLQPHPLFVEFVKACQG